MKTYRKCPKSASCLGKIYDILILYQSINKCKIVLGLHLEGPFINREKKGAHEDQHFVDGFPEGLKSLEKIYGPYLKNVSLITLAPELPGSMEAIKSITDRNIRVSLGWFLTNFVGKFAF